MLKRAVTEVLKENGFAFGAILDLETRDAWVKHFGEDVAKLKSWIAKGFQGDMTYLENLAPREDLELILPDIKSALVVLAPYARGKKTRYRIGKNKSEDKPDGALQFFARYAHGRDYHRVLKKRLDSVGTVLSFQSEQRFLFKSITDSVPFFDRAAARETGLGFVGKNTMLIRPGLGSYFFIATLLTTAPTEQFLEEESKKSTIAHLNCGDCNLCMNACPTQAIVAPYQLDAKRCLSYLSIEKRGPIPEEFQKHFDKTIYGCDICQEVCPYNAVTTDFPMLREFYSESSPLLDLNPIDIALMTREQYEEWFGGTAATRAKYEGLVRNALYHLKAIGGAELQDVLAKISLRKDEKLDIVLAKVSMR